MPTMADASQGRSSIVFMLLSAALFGYLGFGTVWLHQGTNGEFLLFVALLEWTLKISAVAFAASAALLFVHPLAGNILYASVGLAGAVSFAIVAALDYMDPRHTVMSPFILLLFAAWNGLGSWGSLRDIWVARTLSKAKPA